MFCLTLIGNKDSLYPLRFLVGNKSDLRDSRNAGYQVNQERALSFAKTHNMLFFETSAKSPPSKKSGDQSHEEVPFQEDAVEDIVVCIGAKLKRQKRPSAVNSPVYSGSFKVTSRRIPEKEPYMCCWGTLWALDFLKFEKWTLWCFLYFEQFSH